MDLDFQKKKKFVILYFDEHQVLVVYLHLSESLCNFF